MASLPFLSGAAAAGITGRAVAAKATKGGSAGSTEEKSIFDWFAGYLAKQDQFYETDPLLQKVENTRTTSGSSRTSSGSQRGSTTIIGKKNTVAMPEKKNGGGFGLGGLFAKK